MQGTFAARHASSSKRLSRRSALKGGAGLGVTLAASGFGHDGAAQPGTPRANEGMDQPALPADTRLALEAIVARRLAEQRIPGVVAGVWLADRGAWTHAAGISDLRTAAPITIDDHFRIASVSKTFVATVVLQLVDEGQLSLDDTLQAYVPGVPNGDRITIRQLLGMTAGLYNYIDDPEFAAAYTSDPLMPFDPHEVIAIVQRHEPDFPPGAQTRYSDTNYILAGFIIEQLTGERAAAAIDARIMAPLALAGTSFPDTPAMPEPYTRGYAAEPRSADLRDLTESNPAVPWTAGAMISTLRDLRVWGAALAAGTLLSPETQRERLQISPIAAAPGFTFGYGLGIMEINGFLGHNGAIFGYSTWLLHSLAKEATIVVLANRGETQTEFAGGIAIDIAHHLFPEQFPRAAATLVPATPEA